MCLGELSLICLVGASDVLFGGNKTTNFNQLKPIRDDFVFTKQHIVTIIKLCNLHSATNRRQISRMRQLSVTSQINKFMPFFQFQQ